MRRLCVRSYIGFLRGLPKLGVLFRGSLIIRIRTCCGLQFNHWVTPILGNYRMVITEKKMETTVQGLGFGKQSNGSVLKRKPRKLSLNPKP